ncbi:MAG: tetratricopeptide repeat protein [Rhodospirillales bacterium]
MQRGDIDAAARLCRHILTKNANHPDALRILGVIEMQRGDVARAVTRLRRAVQLRPRDALTRCDFGVALERAGQTDDAARAYRDAIACDPDCAPAWCNLGDVLAARGDTDAAIDAYSRAIALTPAYAQAHANLGLALVEAGRTAEALSACRAALAIAPDMLGPRFTAAQIELLHGDFVNGFADYEVRWRLPSLAHRVARYHEPLWDGGPLDGRTILLHDEQGLGDALQFIRYAPRVAARGGRVVVSCDGALVRLVATADGVAAVAARDTETEPCAVRAPLLSLPRLFATTVATVPADVPYLAVPAQARAPAALRDAPGDALKVGIVWAGNPAHARDRVRSCAPDRFLALAGLPGVRLYSLQVGAAAAALAGAGDAVTDLGRGFADFADTAAAVAALDLVITIDSAVAHLAGALARPVWILLPFAPDWRWMTGRDDTPWYPTARLFRQPAPGDWDAVFAAVAAALRARS